jgi:hypothetical protein
MADIEIDWPLDLRPAQQSFYIRTLTTKFENPLTGQVQVLERDAARWVSKLSLVRNELDARRMEALLATLRGSVGHVFMPDFRRQKAKGSLAGSPYLASGVGTTLVITGFTPDAEGVLKAGDLIQTSPGRTHIVLQDIDADEDGEAEVSIAPRLRESVTAGPLVTDNCRVRMRLLDDDGAENSTDNRRLTSFELNLIEVLPQ